MPSIIQVLPESLANQIAAGEVVQRPASVVKELMENSIDAGATEVELVLKDGGRALIQVTDNGKGMTPEDARMCFERHATSKVRKLEDLFALLSFGFRGEALASIAAVARVELQTRQAEDQLGTRVEIAGGRVQKQEAIATLPGTRITVSELFFSVPARRNFLKSTPIETKHCVTELFRAAISRPDVTFRFVHNDELIYHWPRTDMKGRICQMHPQLTSEQLIYVQEGNRVVDIQGFLLNPDFPLRQRQDPYFIVNGRYVRDNRLHYAVLQAYRELQGVDSQPFYVLRLELDPARVDVNIHPTKTEVKFDDEHAITGLLHSTIRRALAQRTGALPMHHTQGVRPAYIDPTRGPTLRESRSDSSISRERQPYNNLTPSSDTRNWETLYGALSHHSASSPLGSLTNADYPCWYIPPNYLFRAESNGIRLVHRWFAWQRITYERLLSHSAQPVPCQQLLYPQTVTLVPEQMVWLENNQTWLQHSGFNLRPLGPTTILISGLPSDGRNLNPQHFFQDLLTELKMGETEDTLREKLACKLVAHSHPKQQKLSPAEIHAFVEQLLACAEPAYSPLGRPTFHLWEHTELEAFFCG
jgi:DNA mismatch repair protein MutL